MAQVIKQAHTKTKMATQRTVCINAKTYSEGTDTVQPLQKDNEPGD